MFLEFRGHLLQIANISMIIWNSLDPTLGPHVVMKEVHCSNKKQYIDNWKMHLIKIKIMYHVIIMVTTGNNRGQRHLNCIL